MGLWKWLNRKFKPKKNGPKDRYYKPAWKCTGISEGGREFFRMEDFLVSFEIKPSAFISDYSVTTENLLACPRCGLCGKRLHHGQIRTCRCGLNLVRDDDKSPNDLMVWND
jgi:hypothetical protein